MEIDGVSLPSELKPYHLRDRAVVVFDVLRATTTIVSAIGNGAKEVRVFGSLDAASIAAAAYDGPKLLAGETRCLPPPEFDLGNSPGDFTADRVAGKTIFLSTTNGTRAIVAASGASRLFAAAFVNVSAMAAFLNTLGMDITLLCSGTDGKPAPEDSACARTIQYMVRRELTVIPRDMGFSQTLRESTGGQNIIAAGLEEDIEYAAQPDRFDTIVEITGLPPIARKASV